MKIYPVIMCGGAGTRLWPVSNRSCPKQFRNLVTDKSVFQDTVLRFKGAEDVFSQRPIVISNELYADLILDQLAEIGVTPQAVLLEPMARNTAAVAAIAARYVHSNDEDGLALLLPSDHFIGKPDVFRDAVISASSVARTGKITIFGIEPDRPETGFGYIQTGDRISGDVSSVAAFKEKPDLETAVTYLQSGAFSWNSGIFLFPASLMLSELNQHAPDILNQSTIALERARQDGAKHYIDADAFADVRSTSVDYAVMEATSSAAVYGPLNCQWNDIGTWSMIGDVSARQNDVEPVMIDSRNCLVHADDGRLVALVGVENLMVVVDGKNVLVTHRDATQSVGQVVKALKSRDMTDYI